MKKNFKDNFIKNIKKNKFLYVLFIKLRSSLNIVYILFFKLDIKNYWLFIFSYIYFKLVRNKTIVIVSIENNILSRVLYPISQKFQNSDSYKLFLIYYKNKYENNLFYNFNKSSIYEFNDRSIQKILFADLFISSLICYKNSPIGSKKIHFTHTMAGIEGMSEKKNLYNNFDYIFCAGEEQIKDFKRYFKKKKLSKKVLIPGGYPKLDKIYKEKFKKKKTNKIKRIVYAPTLSICDNPQHIRSHISKYSLNIIDYLIKNNYQVIFRPHPINLNEGNSCFPYINKIIKKYKIHKNFKLDISSDYSKVYNYSDLMLTDYSGTAFTYAFAFEKPVLFYKNSNETKKLKGIQYTGRKNVGEIVSKIDNLNDKITLLEKNYKFKVRKIKIYRDSVLYNFGESKEYFFKNLTNIISNKKCKNWIYM